MKMPHLTHLLLIYIFATALPISASNNQTADYLTVDSSDPFLISIACSPPSIELTPVEIEGHAYRQLNVVSNALLGNPGGPAVPGWCRWIEIPNGMKPVLNFETGEPRIISNIDIAPFQSATSDNPYISTGLAANPEIYTRDEIIPAQPVTVSDPMTIAGKRWATVTLAPYQCNPARRELYVYDKLDAEVTFEQDPSVSNQITRPRPPAMLELERAISGDSPGRDDLSRRFDNLGGYVIIVDDDEDAIEAVEPLAEWKTRKGFVVTVENMDNIGGRDDLRTWLINAYRNWDVPPTFVLLTADANGRDISIPIYTDGQGEGQSWKLSDNQYVQWLVEDPGGGDPSGWIPDGFIGRLPAERVVELQHMVAKIIAYETDPFVDDPWIEGAMLIANGVRSCAHTNVAVRELMQGFGYDRDDLHEAYADYPQVPNNNYMVTNINEGVGFINFRGYQTWGGIYYNTINDLRNNWKLPVVTGMVCGTNDIMNTWNDSRPECRGEAFLRAWRGSDGIGGVACFGPTDFHTHTWFNNTLNGEFYHSLFINDVSYLGVLCLAAKLSLLRTYPSLISLGNGVNSVGYYFFTYNLLGDPSIQARTREPIVIYADFQAELPVGATNIDILVYNEDEEPVEGAYVHIYLDEDVRYGAFTDEEGMVELEVDPLEEGHYLLTISGQNLIPILTDFEVTSVSNFLSLDEIIIDDDFEGESEGNNDSLLTSGETVELGIILRNSGVERSERATVILTTESPWVDEIGRGEVEYEALDAGEAVIGAEPFVFNLLPETPDGERIEFYLNINCGDNEWVTAFELPTYGYRFEVSDYLFSDTLLTPGTEQGLTIEIENISQLDAGSLNAVLYCDNPTIQIRDAESDYDPIGAGETGENNGDRPFLVFAAPTAYKGSEASFGLQLTDEAGLSDSLIFSVMLGEQTVDAPQGPDGYGYWAFDNRDTTSGMAPEYEWIEGRDRVNGLSDPDDVSATSNHGSRVFHELEFDFTYYGRVYSEITIGSNGWICFGRTDQISWNNQEMGSGLAPPAMVAPFWNDIFNGTVYTYYDEDEARYIIEWRNWGISQRGGNATFEIILYDPTSVVTNTGDGEIVFQYQRLPNLQQRRDYPLEQATIGICSHNRLDKLQITQAANWDPRSAGLVSEMAIRFSTGEFMERGAVRGRVLDFTDESPMEDASVQVDGTGFFDRTDEDGIFLIENIPVGTYNIVARARHFNDGVARDVEIIEDVIQVPTFSLTHPTFNCDIDEIVFGLRPDSTGQVTFNVWNEGNGPLDYNLDIDFTAEPPEERDETWDILFDYNLSDSSRTGHWIERGDDSLYIGDYRLNGITFDGEYFYVTGAFIRGEQPHLIYVFNKEGERVREFAQPTLAGDRATYGFDELEWNGENLYAVEKDTIIELNREGEIVRIIENPVQRAYSIAWSPEDGRIFTRPRTGNIITEFDTSGVEVIEHDVDVNYTFKVYGMAWYPVDPDGFHLYLFVDNGSNVEEPRLRIMKYNTETDEIAHVHFLDYESNNKPVGCAITKLWNPLLWTFVGLMSHGDGDRAFGVELGPNLTWIGFDPQSASVPANENQEITIFFDAREMPTREYYILLKLIHNAVGDRHDIDVFFTIDPEWWVEEDERTIPIDFVFEPPRPNPFNPLTRLRFSLPITNPVELVVFDVSGRLVHEFDLGRVSAGWHQVTFDGTKLSSGIYFAQLKVGSRSLTQKLVLMK